ncbi:MAG: DNA primase [Crenarchaeota archaeon]|nr:DNA primase [Thermoproteota archaeon]
MVLPRCLIDDYDRFTFRYPFTREAKQRVSNVVIEDVLKDREFLLRCLEFIERTLRTGRIELPSDLLEDVEKLLLTLYTSIIIVSLLDKRLWTRFADILSKYFSSNLESEVDRECITYIAEEFGIDVKNVRKVVRCEKLQIFFDVAVPLHIYLRYCPRNDPNWKLVNRYVARGHVLLTYRDLARLVEEAVEKHIVNMLENASKNDIIREIIVEQIGNELKKLETKLLPRTALSISKLARNVSENQIFPPCINLILADVRSGGNPSHMARFTLASFLLNYYVKILKIPVEEAVEKVVDVFRSVADFDERKTRYQVQHIAGLVGGRKFYLPPSCDELRSLGLCPTEGKCRVKNPLGYVVKMMKSLRRERTENRKREAVNEV